MSSKKALHFVYNANSGSLNAVKDSLHKWLSPNTYDCDLCALTHNSFAEVPVWKTFRETSGMAMHFYHKDEFNKQFRSKWLPNYDFPLVLIEADRGLEIFIAADEFKTIETIEALIAVIKQKWQYFD